MGHSRPNRRCVFRGANRCGFRSLNHSSSRACPRPLRRRAQRPANGLPTFATVGLPQGAVKEGRERVYAALANSGFTFPLTCITVKREGRARRLPSPHQSRFVTF